ncbi:hypothetical protein SEA_ZETA1847_32 [Microbacterium phage Zeta1847]|uniref:Uncharacterized protein n=1 Tax=Microbacterium phage Zeta1847 TaxID=2201444 RepID=A0A2Z4Q9B8_9CAUD|nr:hypothetical protein HOT46_gp32 [Microbacterium phage Zeta1847]AWY06666.1 hypothetical protein SEA_ZETA1847_32 [Microbacterium phage Zeta1847]
MMSAPEVALAYEVGDPKLADLGDPTFTALRDRLDDYTV